MRNAGLEDAQAGADISVEQVLNLVNLRVGQPVLVVVQILLKEIGGENHHILGLKVD